MPDIPYLIFIFALALVLAVVEVQIEGPNGWAAKLPAWRPGDKSWLNRLSAAVLSGKPVTGYHLAMNLFVVMVFHWPYFVGIPWSLASEFHQISLLLLFIAVWDFLWFVINPAFGINRFRAGYIWWHPNWFAGLPVDYWKGLVLSGILSALSVGLTSWVFTVALFLILTVLFTLLWPKTSSS